LAGRSDTCSPIFRILTMRYFIRICFFTLIFSSCSPGEKSTKDVPKEDCQTYLSNIHKLEDQILESERNANRLEDVIYRLTQNYMVIDQKIRLIQKYQRDPSQAKLLKRTASEINLFFAHSRTLLDSTEKEIRASRLPQSSMIPVIETVRDYLSHQEKLFIEVYGSIGSIQEQVQKLKETVKAKETEMAQKVQDSEKILEDKEKQNRKIFYLVGSIPELERAKAIKKSGGFLGVGKTIKLSDKFDEMFFQSSDYKIMKEIALGNTKKINLITVHPKGTYMVLETPGEQYLKITNPEKFWSTSKFLVVEVD